MVNISNICFHERDKVVPREKKLSSSRKLILAGCRCPTSAGSAAICQKMTARGDYLNWPRKSEARATCLMVASC
jgi:hypothetical protein